MRKAMIGFFGAWVPCAAHSIHNDVRHALSGSGETAAQRSSRLAHAGGRPARARKGCRNDAAREFLARCRATIRFLEHSPVEALALAEIFVPEDVAVRNLVHAFPTRWGSTYLALCRLYSMWSRMYMSFRSTYPTADQQELNLLNGY